MTKKTVIVSDSDDWEDDHGNDAVDITRKKIDNHCEEPPHTTGRRNVEPDWCNVCTLYPCVCPEDVYPPLDEGEIEWCKRCNRDAKKCECPEGPDKVTKKTKGIRFG